MESANREIDLLHNLEHAGDSLSESDEEGVLNTIGDIPTEWYRDFPHIGYNLEGKRVLKPASGDQLDQFLEGVEDPSGLWKSVKMPNLPGTDLLLSEKEIDMVQRIQKADYPDSQFDPYPPTVEYYTSKKFDTPLVGADEPKRRFVPSKWEHQKVMKLVYAIRQGWIKPKKDFEIDEKPYFHKIWTDIPLEKKDNTKMLPFVPAPKLRLPGHRESYRPPPEYLPTPEEQVKWNAKFKSEKKLGEFLSTQYDSMLEIPFYSQIYQERFSRCLDLYLCPREPKLKINPKLDPRDILPQLPKPKDLQPFPTQLAFSYYGHTGCVRCVSAHPMGRIIASGGDDKTVRVWEVSTGRCLKLIQLQDSVSSIEFFPTQMYVLLLVACGEYVLLVSYSVGNKQLIDETNEILNVSSELADRRGPAWSKLSITNGLTGIEIGIGREVRQVVWHKRGDYFSSVQHDTSHKSVYIHQLSKQKSQTPFVKSKGQIQSVSFHPMDPTFFVCTQRNILIYNLVAQSLVKRLSPSVQWLSCLNIHRGGTNIIAGSQDCKVMWFDLELSRKPYKTLRHHKGAVRSVIFHPIYPLFASCGDEASIVVYHGMVYSDLDRNPLLVPLKALRGHIVTGDMGVLECVFHPTQPWLFSAGADGMVKLFT
ncbi:Ribosome biogenesis protein BOP1 [Oopsacas minuta]|uniref:Ribosome biogenesis protein BOP1 homolog n=1 Tax=Oopsacas minuta TaxID=111878 RepID=A0AAV7JHN0_9METZ|nr:Ribosome biogenesis protein BOP1 [Oopsacas minuta]